MLRSLLSRLSRSTAASAPSATLALGPSALVMVYLREGSLFLEPSDRTRWQEAGFWVASGEVRVLEETVPTEELGAALLAALARSRAEVAVPPRDAKLEAGLFRAMGVRSRRAAMQGTRACVVTREPPAGDIRLEPQRNGGTAGEERGYRPIPGAAIVLPPDAEEVSMGQAVRRALDQAAV